MGTLGSTELMIIFAILLLLFGSTKLPKLARSMGTSIREFKDGVKEEANKKEAADDSDSSDSVASSKVEQEKHV